MASIFRRTSDQGKRHAPYLIQYKDHDGRRKTVKAFSDKAETARLAAKLEHEAMLRARGIIDPDAEQAANKTHASIAGHLPAYRRHLSRNSPKHVQLTMSRIQRIVEAGNLRTVADIDVESVETVLRGIVETDGIGHRTHNHYAQAIDGFCNWMVATRRVPANPIRGLQRLNADVDVRHPRRALTQEEFAKLVDSARSSGVRVQGYDGEQRARIYVIAYLTGLRRAEMASLTPPKL